MKLSYAFLIANNKGADQTALMRSLISAFVVCMQQSQVFSNEVQMICVVQVTV